MIYVGIDVASNKHDCFLINEKGEAYSSVFTISNDLEGFKKLHKAILNFVKQTNDSNVRIGLESTGHYSNNILLYFVKLNYQVMLINPLLTNMDRKATTVRKTKTDKVDARGICMFLDRNKTDFKPYTLISYHKDALKSLSRERFSLIKDYSKQKLKLQRLVTIVFPEYLSFFSNLYIPSSINLLYSYPTPKLMSRAKLSSISNFIHGKCKINAQTIKDKSTNSIGQSSDYYAFEIKSVIDTLRFYEKQIESYNDQIKTIMDEVGKNIMSIPGISYINGALILSEIGDINNFESADKLLEHADDLKMWNNYIIENGIKFKDTTIEVKSNSCASLSVCFTGVRDKQMEQYIVENGGKIVSGVSKKCTLLITMDPSVQSTKLKKASELGIQIISYNEALDLFK